MVKNILVGDGFPKKVVLLVLLVILILSTSWGLTRLRQSVVAKELELSLQKRDYELLDKIIKDKNEEQEKIDKVLLSLPQTYEEIGILAYKIENAGKARNLSTSLFFEEEAVEEAGILSVELEVVTEGGFRDFSEFLSDLTTLPYNTEIVNIVTEIKDGKVTNETTIKVYIRK